MNGDGLQAILKTEHKNAGFRLEADEHVIYLYNIEGKKICVFSSYGAKVSAIQNEVDMLMAG